ncbi:hypothetical protein TrST_g7174 [Triparma strigata]|uniref:Uncharacterized protein n=1 Tax=Triparma strigata TaxID=1606541 RepID=A0A9W7APF6_9STRA|nr:hypothetical protein TrST_g7174 [Triparma strigata]
MTGPPPLHPNSRRGSPSSRGLKTQGASAKKPSAMNVEDEEGRPRHARARRGREPSGSSLQSKELSRYERIATRTLGTALTTLLLILLSIVLSSATSLISTIQTTQVPAASADSRANWALTNAGEWSAYVSTYYYVIDAPVRFESDGGGSGNGSGGGGGGGGGGSDSNTNSNNGNKPSRHALVHTSIPRNGLTAWLDRKLVQNPVPVLSATEVMVLLSSLPVFVNMPGMVNNIKVNEEGFGSVEGVLEGLFGSGIGVKAGEFYWRYYTSSTSTSPLLEEEERKDVTITKYLTSLAVHAVQTCTFLIALHSVPQLLKLNHVPRWAIYLIGLAWWGVDMRPEIAVAAGAAGSTLRQSWKLAGSMLGAMMGGKLCREWFPLQ